MNKIPLNEKSPSKAPYQITTSCFERMTGRNETMCRSLGTGRPLTLEIDEYGQFDCTVLTEGRCDDLACSVFVVQY